MRVKIHCYKAIHQHKQFCLGVGWKLGYEILPLGFIPFPVAISLFIRVKGIFFKARDLSRASEAIPSRNR